MRQNPVPKLAILALGMVCLGLPGCGGGGAAAAPPPATITAVAVTPSTLALDGSAPGTFSATVSGTGPYDPTVTWSALLGSISAQGSYTPPTAGGIDLVRATSVANPAVSGTALVTVVPPSRVRTVAVAPAAPTLSQGGQATFTATVAGDGGFSSGVTWSASTGTITADGRYTAPFSGTTDLVTATSVQDPTVSGSVPLTLAVPASLPAPPVPVLSAPAEVQAGSGPYTASVALPAGLTVQWTVAGATILTGAQSASMQFQAGAGPLVTLTCTVADAAGSAVATRRLPALPFPPRDHLADLKAVMAAYATDIETEALSGDPPTYYDTSYYLHGLAAGAEATGDLTVMDTLVSREVEMISVAQSLARAGVTYPEWGPWDVNGNPQQLDTFQGAEPLARTAALIARIPAFRARYAANLPQILAFVDQSVFKYWFDKNTGIYADPGSGYLGGDLPWLSTSLGGWGTYPVWSDKCSHVGSMSAWMYQATGDPLYQEYASRIAQGFKTHVTLKNGACLWDLGIITAADDSDNQDGSPDTSHANREPMMATALYEAGIGIQLADLQAMAATFDTVIWNRSTTSPAFTNYIDGGNPAYGTHLPWENGDIYLGWNRLGRYDAQAAWILAVTDQMGRTQPDLNLSVEVNASRYGLLEQAGTLAWLLAQP
jgi:hypothetical protein